MPTGERRAAVSLWWEQRHLADLTRDRRGLRLTHSEHALARLAGRPLPSVALAVRARPHRGAAVAALAGGDRVPPPDHDGPGAIVITDRGGEPPAVGPPTALWDEGERRSAAERVAASAAVGSDRDEALPLVVVAGTWRAPAAGEPSSHRLRPPDRLAAEGAGNELLCRAVLEALGVATVPLEPVAAGESRLLLEGRPDRVVGPTGVVLRRSWEPLTTAAGVDPAGAPDDGAKVAAVVDRWAADPRAVDRLLTQLTALVLLGAAAHGFDRLALAQDAAGAVGPAPLAGVICTTVSPHLGRRGALSLAGCRDLAAIERRDLVAEGVAWGLSAARAATAVDRVLDEAPAAIWRAVAAERPSAPLAAHLLERARRLRGEPVRGD